jgi:hypothetical protein
MDINSLRKMRNSDFSKIAQEFEKTANPQQTQSYEDTRFWKPERDKAGNAQATIRFLPRTEGDELPWVKIFSHGFQGPSGKWYIENSLTTLGQNDPVGELNSKLWNSGSEANKDLARKQKRRLHYISNILVVSDPKHPENEGQVFLFKYGKKIFDKIMDKARPTFEDEEPVNVFDYWEGANFKLRMKTVEGYPNYDQSTFAEPSVMLNDDEEILEVANKQHKLSEFLDAKNFKSYDELKKKLDMVLSGEFIGMTAEEIAEQEDRPVMEAPQPAAKPPVKVASKPSKVVEVTDSDDDDVLSYFQSLTED